MCSRFCQRSILVWRRRMNIDAGIAKRDKPARMPALQWQRVCSRFSVSPAARCPGTTSWRQFTRRQHMRKAAVVCMVLLAVMLIAPAAFAQGSEAAGKAPINTTTLVIAVGFGVAGAGVGGGLGQGRIA